jgi:hypothetical protein
MQCLNCGAELTGRWCSQCGQRASDPRPTLHELLHEALHELMHLDGKLVRTAGLLLFKPGELTREFREGKRARSVTPIRLYLICSVLFFSVISLLPTRPLKVNMTKGADAQLTQAAARVNRDPAILSHALTTAFPKAMFILMPLFGLIAYAFYFRVERLYVPHFYFAVHYHAFAFVAFTVFELLTLIHVRYAGLIRFLLLFFMLFAYLAMALRRVYGGTKVLTAAKVLGITAIYGVFVLLTMAAIVLMTLRHL